MSIFSIADISTSKERYKIYTLLCSSDKLPEAIKFVNTNNIQAVNIGKQLAVFLDELEDYSYLMIEVYDYLNKLLTKYKNKIKTTGNDVVTVYNLGILLEPRLKLNSVEIFKEFSKSAALVIIWENKFEIPDRLNWPTQKQKFFLDFSDISLKKMQDAV